MGGGGAKGSLEVGDVALFLDNDPSLPLLSWFAGVHGRYVRTRRNRSEISLDQSQHFVSLEVAHSNRQRVVGCVVCTVVGVELVAGHRLKITHVADGISAIWVYAKRGSHHLFVEQKFGIVLSPLPLADNDRALGSHLVRVKEGVGHPVGLNAQSQLDASGGQRSEVGGEIVPRHSVERAALAGYGLFRHAFREHLGALEEHVLDPVRDAGDSCVFVATPYPVPDPDAGHRSGVRFFDQHSQSVI